MSSKLNLAIKLLKEFDQEVNSIDDRDFDSECSGFYRGKVNNA